LKDTRIDTAIATATYIDISTSLSALEEIDMDNDIDIGTAVIIYIDRYVYLCIRPGGDGQGCRYRDRYSRTYMYIYI